MRSIILVAAALLLAACSPSTGASTSTTGPGTEPTAEADTGVVGIGGGATPFLVAFDSCDALLGHLHEEASERVGPYGLDGSGGPWIWMEGDVATERMAESADGAETAAADDSGGDSGGSDGFTGTNVQEAGVDEPDIVKTDGSRILTISENVLSHVDASGDDPVVTDQLDLGDGWASELFLTGDRALVFTNADAGPVEPLDDPVAGDAITRPGWARPTVVVLEVDLSDPADLEVTGRLAVDGQYLSARAIDGMVRIAVNTAPTQLPWVYPSGPAGEERAEETNRQLVLDTTIEDWLPGYELTDADGRITDGRLLPCESVSRPAEFSGFDFVSVLTIDAEEGLDPGDAVAVLAGGQQVYASLDRFYVATTEWAGEEIDDQSDLREWSEEYTTSIHAFDITGDGPAVYVASGELEGSLLNQFSMDEHDGYLRVVTTEGSPWDERDTSETFLTVLSEEGDRLSEVGRVGGLGKGETLYSARLLDDVGFAVTFRQVDPFYVIDLSDPTDPRVTGELKIPGFSTYLHPVGDDLVVGIGQDATAEGRVTGFKVSLFSVADPADPVEIDTYTVENAGSPAEHDHRAFQFLAEQNLAIVPVAEWNGELNGAVLLEIGADGLEERGTVTHVEPSSEPTTDCRKLESSDFGDDTELFWMAESGAVLYCEEGQEGGYGAFTCDPIPVDELRGWLGSSELAEDAIDDLGLSEDGRIEVCWPDDGQWRRQIQRSLVIGDRLWTMSTERLQANALDTLDVEARLSID